MTTTQITLATICTIQSIILFWQTTKYILEKKQILPFIPFILAGITMSFAATIGFHTTLNYNMLTIIKTSLLATTIFILINIRKIKWN